MGTGNPAVPGSITVDTTTETVTLQITDDKGDVLDASSVPGASVQFATSDPNIATIAPDASNAFQGDITPVGVGTVQISAAVSGVNDAQGNPLPNPDAVSLQVDPGAPAGERLVLAGGQ